MISWNIQHDTMKNLILCLFAFLGAKTVNGEIPEIWLIVWYGTPWRIVTENIGLISDTHVELIYLQAKIKSDISYSIQLLVEYFIINAYLDVILNDI